MTVATEIVNENLTPPGGEPETFTRSRASHHVWARFVNNVVVIGCYICALVTISALLAILGYILYRGIGSINWAFFSRLPAAPDEVGGMRNGIAGTLVLIGMASVVGIPVGMLCGIYLAEYSRDNWFNHAIRLVVDVLAGVPSIIVGVLGYILVVKPLGGNSAWAGAVALGFMMCPIIARTTEEMLKLVPKALREASIGIGASKSQTLVRVVIPAASSGIITGIMLAIARVAGETAPLLFTVLGSDQPILTGSGLKLRLDLDHAFPALPLQVFKYATSAEPEWINEAWTGMVVLITIILVLNLLVRYFSRNKVRAAK